MNRFCFPKVLYVGLLVMLTACQAAKQQSQTVMLKPGDLINGMGLAIGASDATPLWAFCSNSLEGEGSYILDCHAPALRSLAIGNIFSHAGEEIINSNNSDLLWKLSIDAQEVDLDSFGTFDYVMPGISKSPSQVREIFIKGTAWNLVLTNLKPGHHTLWFVAQDKVGSYTWFVNLELEPVDETDDSSIPFHTHS